MFGYSYRKALEYRFLHRDETPASSKISSMLPMDCFLCVDRYSAYKCFVKTLNGFVLVFCWVHVRRDFLDVGKSWPMLEAWSLDWVNLIGELFHLNKQHIHHASGSAPFLQADSNCVTLLKLCAGRGTASCRTRQYTGSGGKYLRVLEP